MLIIILLNSCTEDDSINSVIYGSTVTDIDGHVYHTVKIGSQTWMVENLKTTRLNDGTEIPLVDEDSIWTFRTTPCFCFYHSTGTNRNTYGALYNWYTVNTGKLAPIGWHVPSDAEWAVLENYLIANRYNYDGTSSKNLIAKSLASKSVWISSTNKGAIGNDLSKNNTTGFAALPGGFRNIDGTFYNMEIEGYWWSSTQNHGGMAWYRQLNYSTSNVDKGMYEMQLGFSVRCIQNN